MVRRLIVGFVGIAALLLGSIVVSDTAGAVVDSATIVPSPNMGNPGQSNNELYSVACVSATSCTAVGYHDVGEFQMLIEVWDGIAWTVTTTPELPFDDELNSVSCVSATSCTAVGYSSNGSEDETLVMVSNGNVWSRVASPNAGTGIDNELNSVSCVSASSCVAVGIHDNEINSDTLAMVWDGSVWTLVSSPNIPDADNNQLLSVSCVSATSCMAVGWYDDGRMSQSLSMAWDGSAWTLVPVPFAGVDNNDLYSVSCLTVTSCIAVGKFDDNQSLKTLVVEWDGSMWQIVSSPSAGSGDNELLSVMCLSTSSCAAVGRQDSQDNGVWETLVLAWDGSTWQIVSSPNAGTSSDQLKSVSCATDDSCMAVGFYDGTATRTLAMSLAGPEPVPETTTTTAGVTTTTDADPVVPVFAG